MKSPIKKLKIGILLLAVFLLIIIVISDLSDRPDHKSDQKLRNAKIGNAQIQVEIADDLGEQIQGLSERVSLCEDCGMLFIYDQPQELTFWMKDMRFALDIIFIRHGKITEIFENVQPPGETGGMPKVVVGHAPADNVLEVNAGFARKHGLKISDPVQLK